MPEHPAAADYLAAMGGGWQILGNDALETAGCDLGERPAARTRRSRHRALPIEREVWAVYETQNPTSTRTAPPIRTARAPADGGMDIQTLLEYLVSDGGPDGVTAVSFAGVDHTDPAAVNAAMATFGSLCTGMNVTEDTSMSSTQGAVTRPVANPASGRPGGTGGEGALKPERSAETSGYTWALETSFSDTYWARRR